VRARQGDRQRRERVELSQANDEQKAMSLMLREHLINLTEAVTEKQVCLMGNGMSYDIF
jgi:hypothetical protein